MSVPVCDLPTPTERTVISVDIVANDEQNLSQKVRTGFVRTKLEPLVLQRSGESDLNKASDISVHSIGRRISVVSATNSGEQYLVNDADDIESLQLVFGKQLRFAARAASNSAVILSFLIIAMVYVFMASEGKQEWKTRRGACSGELAGRAHPVPTKEGCFETNITVIRCHSYSGKEGLTSAEPSSEVSVGFGAPLLPPTITLLMGTWKGTADVVMILIAVNMFVAHLIMAFWTRSRTIAKGAYLMLVLFIGVVTTTHSAWSEEPPSWSQRVIHAFCSSGVFITSFALTIYQVRTFPEWFRSRASDFAHCVLLVSFLGCIGSQGMIYFSTRDSDRNDQMGSACPSAVKDIPVTVSSMWMWNNTEKRLAKGVLSIFEQLLLLSLTAITSCFTATASIAAKSKGVAVSTTISDTGSVCSSFALATPRGKALQATRPRAAHGGWLWSSSVVAYLRSKVVDNVERIALINCLLVVVLTAANPDVHKCINAAGSGLPDVPECVRCTWGVSDSDHPNCRAVAQPNTDFPLALFGVVALSAVPYTLELLALLSGDIRARIGTVGVALMGSHHVISLGIIAAVLSDRRGIVIMQLGVGMLEFATIPFFAFPSWREHGAPVWRTLWMVCHYVVIRAFTTWSIGITYHESVLVNVGDDRPDITENSSLHTLALCAFLLSIYNIFVSIFVARVLLEQCLARGWFPCLASVCSCLSTAQTTSSSAPTGKARQAPPTLRRQSSHADSYFLALHTKRRLPSSESLRNLERCGTVTSHSQGQAASGVWSGPASPLNLNFSTAPGPNVAVCAGKLPDGLPTRGSEKRRASPSRMKTARHSEPLEASTRTLDSDQDSRSSA